MSQVSFLDRCVFSAVSAGSTIFVVNAAITGYQTPAIAGVIDGFTYRYHAQSTDLTQWEYGYGVYTAASASLSRNPVGNSTNSTLAINFTNPPQVTITMLSQDVYFALAAANTTFYVRTTGSDTNPLTNNGFSAGTAFLTIQHALNISAQYDWQEQFVPTVDVGAGVFDNSGANLTMPQLKNIGRVNRGVLQGAGSTTTTIKLVGKQIIGNGPDARWTHKSYQVDFGTNTGNAAWEADAGADFLLTGTLQQEDTSGSGSGTFFAAQSGGFINLAGITLNITANFATFIGAASGTGGSINWFSGTINLPSTFTVGSAGWWIDSQNGSPIYIFFESGTVINNSSNYVGPKVFLSANYALLQTSDGTLNHIPGTYPSGSLLDCSVAIANQAGFAALGVQLLGGPIDTSKVFPDTFNLTRDTTNGPISISVNNNGTIYTRQIGNNINLSTSTSYTLALSDQEGIVEMGSTGDNMAVVPPSSVTNFPKGTKISVVPVSSTGVTTIAASTSGSVTVQNAGAVTGSALLYKRSTGDLWRQINGAF